jgi:hypothetical protein
MKAPRIYVSEAAFLQLLVSSVELYPGNNSRAIKKSDEKDGETYGYVFGSRITQQSRSVYRVEFVVPCQRVRGRSCTSVQPSEEAEGRILSVLSPFPGLDLLGTFHSHLYTNEEQFKIPDSVAPSSEDHTSWKAWWDDERKGLIGLELIVGLKKLNRRGTQPTHAMDNCIEGRWERFAYAIGGWYTTKKQAASPNDDNILRPAHWIMCPTAFGFTREDLRDD